MPLQPGFDLRMLVPGSVVTSGRCRQSDASLIWARSPGRSAPETGFILGGGTALLAVGDQHAIGHAEGCQQWRGAMAFVVVCHRAELTGIDWQAVLLAAEHRDLTFPVARERQRMLGRIPVQAHDIDPLFHERRIIRHFEGLGQRDEIQNCRLDNAVPCRGA